MRQVLHGSARTTEAVRRTIQHSQESLRGLAKRHGINQTTVTKWKKRTAVKDLPAGPKVPHLMGTLTIGEEAVIVAFDVPPPRLSSSGNQRPTGVVAHERG